MIFLPLQWTSAVATQLQPVGHRFCHSFMCYTWEKKLWADLVSHWSVLWEGPGIFLELPLSSFSPIISCIFPTLLPFVPGIGGWRGLCFAETDCGNSCTCNKVHSKLGELRGSWEWGGKAPGDNGGGLYLVLLESLFSCSNAFFRSCWRQTWMDAAVTLGLELALRKITAFQWLSRNFSLPEHLCVHHPQSQGKARTLSVLTSAPSWGGATSSTLSLTECNLITRFSVLIYDRWYIYDIFQLRLHHNHGCKSFH